MAMTPEGTAAPAPTGPGPAPTPGGAPASPADQAMAQQEQADMEQRQAIAASAPEPDKPFSVKKIQSLLEEFKKTIKKLAGDVPVENLVWDPPGGESKWDAPLPDPVFPAMVLSQAVLEAAGPEFQDKHGFDPMELVNDSALAMAQAKIRGMGSDKKLKSALDELSSGQPEEKAPEPEAEKKEPESKSEEATDERLMESM